MRKLLWFLVVFIGPMTPVPYALAAKADYGEWTLDVRFINASKVVSTDALRPKIADWVQNAERIYQRRPRLKIRYEIVEQKTKDGRDLSRMVFDTLGSYATYMDRNFDNVAVTRTEGHLTVLITDQLCIGTYRSGARKGQPKCWGGYAHFPHWVNPFGRKRGITLKSNIDEYTLAHELGHVFGLKHTFEPYVGLNLQCNEEYKPKGKPAGLCNSCANGMIVYDSQGNPDECNGPANLMDYCSSQTDNEFLNPCQEERASNQRYAYMTADGKTDYFALKGLAGEAICQEDGDCEEGRYCDTGTADVGRNQCKELKAQGAVCTRGGECGSGRCAGLRCAEAHECEDDGDCDSGKYCKRGLGDLDRNECKTKLTDWTACTNDSQCASGHCSQWRPQDGQTSGICYTPSSKAGGADCKIDLECRAGKCNSNKRCVCKNDGDCNQGYWCDAGIDTNENQCKRKLDKGEVCGTVGEVGVGHRCKSGECRVSGLSTKLTCK